MNIQNIVEAIEKANGNPRFASFVYTSKKHNETARYTLLIGASYEKICSDDILELQIRLGNAQGIEKVVIEGIIASLKESINAMREGRDHVNYTKAGLYRPVCQGIKVALNDLTCEVQGLQHAKQVIVPGEYKAVKHRTQETALKADIRKSLKVGKWKTLCLDIGNMSTARVNGEILEFE